MMDRQHETLQAAFSVFSKYGVKRTTMNDIAVEAGVSRQTLYNSFANKEAILHALVLQFVDETLEQIDNHCADKGNLEDLLELVFDRVAREPFEMLRNTPHGHEMLDGITDKSEEALQEGYQKFCSHSARALGTFCPALGKEKAEEIGAFLIYAAMGLKQKAQDTKQLNSLLSTLKNTILLLIKS